MGILVLEETNKAELEEFRRMLLSRAAVHRRKDDEGFGAREDAPPARNGDVLDRMVCVTSGVSYLGIAIVNQLLVGGYSVRILVDNEEDVEKLSEMEISGEMRPNRSLVEVAMVDLTKVESLVEAFEGCRGVFHTAAFVDPTGLSGYSKAMADVEVKATKNVVKACGVSSSVCFCVLTSSLLTCIWRENLSNEQILHQIDHKTWSDESVCINKKLWYALGKLRAEKAAWKIAKESRLKLAAICPGLITGSKFYQRNPTSTIAYLKRAREMYAYGLLATVEVNKLAKAHVAVFEEMKMGCGCGRYVCFDKVIEQENELEKLASEVGISSSSIIEAASCSSDRPRFFELSNVKLCQLMLRTQRCHNE
ncbi:NAD(P)-binding Rossmann-fold superfamily protein [Striga hermonthica]|uniref:NAD(P)-binding Rossmann-fold superfamily protein n=1 Tax=Striga hermonthica TaxID=68872 RepID=A0A9N7N4A8_STRHE|nr:NAD(P)-binding Rossmann-fold superfamily protein [Striga hermonthica]